LVATAFPTALGRAGEELDPQPAPVETTAVMSKNRRNRRALRSSVSVVFSINERGDATEQL
jgi:hypothetical protein